MFKKILIANRGEIACRVAATARTMLVNAAAKQWGVKPDSCVAKNHRVVHAASGRSLEFGALVAFARKEPIPKPEAVRLRPEAELLHVGKELPHLDAPAFVNGTAQFGADVSVPADASGYERIGALMARAIGTDEEPGGAGMDATADSILAGLSTAGLMSADGSLDRRGSLVLFVAGSPTGTEDEQKGASSILSTVATAVDADTDGVVVAGPIASARDHGVVRGIRDDVVAARDVSTVDALGRAAARIVAVMALAGQGEDQTGHYGAVDAADGAMPGASSGE